MSRFRKDDVFNFANEVEKFLKMLEGTCIESPDKDVIKNIESQKEYLDKLVVNFKPTVYEEYSKKAHVAYKNMMTARKKYETAIIERYSGEIIQNAKESYENSVSTYEAYKKFRNTMGKLNL